MQFLDFLKSLPEPETPNNFCPSRFSQVRPEFHFLQIANIDTALCPDFRVYTFSFSSKHKSRHTYFQITQVCIDLQKKRCQDFLKYVRILIFIKNTNLTNCKNPNSLKCMENSKLLANIRPKKQIRHPQF